MSAPSSSAAAIPVFVAPPTPRLTACRMTETRSDGSTASPLRSGQQSSTTTTASTTSSARSTTRAIVARARYVGITATTNGVSCTAVTNADPRARRELHARKIGVARRLDPHRRALQDRRRIERQRHAFESAARPARVRDREPAVFAERRDAVAADVQLQMPGEGLQAAVRRTSHLRHAPDHGVPVTNVERHVAQPVRIRHRAPRGVARDRARRLANPAHAHGAARVLAHEKVRVARAGACPCASSHTVP